MTFTTVPDKASGDSFTEVMWDTYLRDNLNKGVWRPIQQALLTGDQAAITFSGIAADHKHLKILLNGYNNVAGGGLVIARLRLNGDSTGNYNNVYQTLNSGVRTDSRDPSTTYAWVGWVIQNTGNGLTGSSVIWLPDYANTSFHKTILADGAVMFDGTSYAIGQFHSRWVSAAAITSIELSLAAGSFAAPTLATLYAGAGV